MPSALCVQASYSDALERVAYAAKQAKKDNDTIYNATVPPPSSLPHLAARSIVKATPTAALTAPLLANEDPFVFIVPQVSYHDLPCSSVASPSLHRIWI